MVDQIIWSGFLEFHFKKNSLVILMFVQFWARTPSLEFNHTTFYHIIMKTWEKEYEDLASLPLVCGFEQIIF